jgi:hypothetical protein
VWAEKKQEQVLGMTMTEEHYVLHENDRIKPVILYT